MQSAEKLVNPLFAAQHNLDGRNSPLWLAAPLLNA